MTIREFLEQDKERLLSRLSATDKADESIRIMEDEMDRILLKAGEEWKDKRVDVLQSMLTTAKAALPVLDSTGEVKVYDRRENRGSGARKKKGFLMLLFGLLFAGVSFTVGAAVRPESLQVLFYALMGVMQAGGLVSAAVGGGLLGKGRDNREKDQIFNVTLDADKIYHHMSLLGSAMDQQLEETLALPAPADTDAAETDAASSSGIDKNQLQLFSNILEAAYAEENSEFASEIAEEVKYYLHQAGIEALDMKAAKKAETEKEGWMTSAERYFDKMPGTESKTLRPALVKDGKVLVKGLYAGDGDRA